MNPYLIHLIIQLVLKNKYKGNQKRNNYTRYEIAAAYREFLLVVKRWSKDILLISLGILSATFGIKGFLLGNGFIDGGVTGISLLVSTLTNIPLWVLIIGINTPFILLGIKIVGRQFAVKTIFAIAGLALCIATIDFAEVTDDSLLVAIFGGFFLGAGIGLSVRGGAVIDGTEVLAIYLSRKFSTSIGDIIIAINIIIFSTAAYLLGVEIAMYAIITYMAASKTLDFIVEGIEEYIGVTIVSKRSEAIRQMIIEKMGRGVTIYKGKRGYGKPNETKDVDIIYTVITRVELNKLKLEIEKIEPEAFYVMNSVKEAKGGVIKKRPFH